MKKHLSLTLFIPPSSKCYPRIGNQIRQDRELGLNVTLWHRNLHFGGITPKISYQYQRVNSNLADLYSYKRDRVYLSFEKSF